MAIYTKRGDKGETGLYSETHEKRVAKNSKRIAAIGAIDEANSYLGICEAKLRIKNLKFKIKQIQEDLFVIGAILATADIKFDPKRVLELEADIDKWEGQLPVLSHFILPGGSELAAHLFYSRALVRKAERAMVSLKTSEPVDNNLLQYINRLSDFLFMLGRLVNFKGGKIESIWPSLQKSKNR